MTDKEAVEFIKETFDKFEEYCDPRVCTTETCAIKKYMNENKIRVVDCQMIFLVFKLIGNDIL